MSATQPDVTLSRGYICRIPVQGFGVTDFDLSEDRLEGLIGSGYNAMVTHSLRPPERPFSRRDTFQKSLSR